MKKTLASVWKGRHTVCVCCWCGNGLQHRNKNNRALWIVGRCHTNKRVFFITFWYKFHFLDLICYTAFSISFKYSNQTLGLSVLLYRNSISHSMIQAGVSSELIFPWCTTFLVHYKANFLLALFPFSPLYLCCWEITFICLCAHLLYSFLLCFLLLLLHFPHSIVASLVWLDFAPWPNTSPKGILFSVSLGATQIVLDRHSTAACDGSPSAGPWVKMLDQKRLALWEAYIQRDKMNRTQHILLTVSFSSTAGSAWLKYVRHIMTSRLLKGNTQKSLVPWEQKGAKWLKDLQ